MPGMSPVGPAVVVVVVSLEVVIPVALDIDVWLDTVVAVAVSAPPVCVIFHMTPVRGYGQTTGIGRLPPLSVVVFISTLPMLAMYSAFSLSLNANATGLKLVSGSLSDRKSVTLPSTGLILTIF